MNERIKELAEQAGVAFDSLGASYTYGSLPDFLERFAELVRQDLYQVIGKSVIEQINSAVQMEREACAKVCESIDAEYEGEDVLATWCADAIRARGNT